MVYLVLLSNLTIFFEVNQYMESKRTLTDISKEELFSLTNKDRQSVFFSKIYSVFGFSIYRGLILAVPSYFILWLIFIIFFSGSDTAKTDSGVFALIIITWPILFLILIYVRELPPVQVQADGISQGKHTVSWGRILEVSYTERSGKIFITSKSHTEKIKLQLKKASDKTRKNLGNVLKKRCEAKNIPYKG